jgi:hypothetical protein
MNTIKNAFNLLSEAGFALVMCIVTYWVGADPIRGLLFEGNTPPGIHITALSILVIMCFVSLLNVWKRWRSLWK